MRSFKETKGAIWDTLWDFVGVPHPAFEAMAYLRLMSEEDADSLWLEGGDLLE